MINDKRVIKTRTAIKTAFMQLMLENEISKITVSSVSERAQINRSTFYLHYSDVNAIMKDIENEIEEKITACIDKFDIDAINESTFTLFTNLTDMLNENQTVKSYILESTASVYLTVRLKEILVEKTQAALLETFPELNAEKIFYPLTFAASGIVDTYVKWVNNDDKAISLEWLIKTVSGLVQPIFEFINS